MESMNTSEPTGTTPTEEAPPQPAGGAGVHPPLAEGAAAEGSVFKRTFSSLGNIEFRYLWAGQLFMMGAMQMQIFARGFYVYDLTESAIRLGVVSAGIGVPGLLLALHGGVLVDRLEKKRIIQWGQAALALLALVVAVLVLTGEIRWEHLLVASVIHGSIMPFIMPARMAILPQIVKRDKIMNASALNSLAMSVTTMLAPALAGGLAKWAGMENLYFSIAGMYVAALVVTRRLGRHRQCRARQARARLATSFRGSGTSGTTPSSSCCCSWVLSR